MKKLTILFLGALLTFAGCESQDGTISGTQESTERSASKKIIVVASFYPLAEFARNVGGDRVEVFTVTPPGAEPHEYEPTAKDIVRVRESGIFLLNGGGQDAWAEKIQNELKQKGIIVLNMSEQIEYVKNEGEEEHDGEEHEFDPHVWLDPVLASREVEAIRDALIQADPTHEDTYREEASEYTSKIAALDMEFRAGLSVCKRKEFITAHRAFGYLASRYGLDQIAISGISTEEEPSAKQIGEISDLAKEKGIKYIFFETLVSPKLSETIATEIGAQTMVLNPIEGLTGTEVAAGQNYVTLMQDNLKNLRTALECD
ncbi:MAG TPA: zinc ABC transporter substrate-binding protein [Candidatus Gracilibacteria bacterium]|nr:zinc ABC transporter substrate-binding protein [Candidatus Gracilibacteria bacterium]